MHRKIILLTIALLPLFVLGQRKKFQVNGAARAYFFANTLDIADDIDTVTTRAANYGQTLLDLGISVFPNKNTEVLGMFRIRNDLGGFWGGGVSFNVRQLTLKGVAGNVVRYELGDIDLSMTPYTLWNFREEGVVNEADVFALRRDIVYYDMFYIDDNWRMQGGRAAFGLEFANVIEGIEFDGFLTRQRPASGTTEPERLYGGGTVTLRQSDDLSLAFHSVNIFDLAATIPDSILYKNNVHTLELNYTRDLNENVAVGLSAEAGVSSARYINYTDPRAPEAQNEWFYDAGITTGLKKLGITAKLAYKDVGADFLSPGAQTKRIDYSRFPGLYQQFTNAGIGRPVSYADFISGNTENSFRISEQLLPYFSAYANTNPYGLATPNRRGIYLDAERTDSTKFRSSFLRVAALTQSRGTGTDELKNFLLVEAGTDLYLNDFWGGEKDLKLDLGLRFENTSRGGEVFETIDLTSTFIDAGLSWEFVPRLDALAGAKVWSVSGNSFVNARNRFNLIENFETVNYDFTENALAAGLRYRFKGDNTLSAQYQRSSIAHADEALADYAISQMTILFSLNF
ncbi:MAG: hypothetical protein AAF998_14115 [Bacteroidota bacterium]